MEIGDRVVVSQVPDRVYYADGYIYTQLYEHPVDLPGVVVEVLRSGWIVVVLECERDVRRLWPLERVG